MSRILPGSFEASQARRQKLNNELADVAKHLSTIGPQVNEIARRSSQHKESVRYRYKKFFLKRGVTVQATPNYGRLGFVRLIVFAELAPEFESQDSTIFTLMSETCYLRSFIRTILGREYCIHVAVPRQLKEECTRIYKRYHEVGLFTKCRILEFEQIRNSPMKAEFYDFSDGSWKFDWPDPRSAAPIFAPHVDERVEKYDRFDLLILKELEIDANRSLVNISRRLNLPVRTLQFHYLHHVLERHLVRAYNVSWQGSRYDFENDRPVTRKDQYVEIVISLEGGTKLENAELRGLLNRIPFLWSEAYEPNYCVELFIPHGLYVQFLEYLEGFAARVGNKMRVLSMHQDRALRFTISYKLFDAESKTWRLDEESVNGMLDDLIKRSKTVGSVR